MADFEIYFEKTAEPVRDTILPYIDQCKRLVPRWMSLLYVALESDSQSHAIMTVNIWYRWARLVITPSFFQSEHPLEVIVHEFAHLHTNAFGCGSIDHARDALGDSSKEGELMYNQFINEREGATEDLAEVFLRLMRG